MFARNFKLHIATLLIHLVAGVSLAAGDGSFPADALNPDDSSEVLLDAPLATEPKLGDRFHTYLSENVEALSRSIDSFFGADRIYEEATDTYLQLRGSAIYTEDDTVDFDGSLRVKLDLPRLEKRLRLVIESQGDEDPREDGLTSGAATLRDSVDEKDLAASLQYALRARKTWDIRLQPGVRIKNPPEPFVRLRMRWSKPLGEKWLVRTTLRPQWSDPDGWDTRLRLDFDRRTGRYNLARSVSEIIWLPDEDEDLLFSQAFLYSHPLGERNRLAYEAGVFGTIEPVCRDTGYYASVRFRRDVYRGWMFLELKPQVVFDREEDFSAEPSLALNLEMLFGSEYLVADRR